jgi:hypothetical protein
MALPFLLSPPLSHSVDHLYELVVGDATGLQSGENLYKEVHCGAENELPSDVYYQSSDGVLIAHKALNYKSGRTTPSFFQTDTLNEGKVAVNFDQKALVMSIIDGDGTERNRQYKVSALEKTPIVIDAGFDVFIRDNWQTLLSGQILFFQFPLVSRFQLISLQVKKSLCEYEANTDQCFTLEPSNWLFRMLASPIELGYDSTLRRLNRYRGLSNINKANGDDLVVDIKYQYGQTVVACNFEKVSKVEKISVI